MVVDMAVLTFTLSIFSIGLLLEILILCHRVPALKAKEQAFRFHELRDDLQLLAIEGKISISSPVYADLMRMLNVAIRNPGIMKLREIVWMAVTVRDQIKARGVANLQEQLLRENPEVQAFASRCFLAYSQMLISNDLLVRTAFSIANLSIAPIKAVVGPIYRFMKRVAPTHAQAMKQANWYSKTGRQLAASPA